MYISQNIVHELLEDYGNVIRIPDNILKEVSSEQKAFDEYVKVNGHYPENGENVLLNGKEYCIGKTKIATVVSGNKPISEDDEIGELFDLLTESNENDSEVLDMDIKSEMLQEIISSLTKQEQEILFYAFFTDMEISEIVYLLKPHTKYDRERLYKRSKNSLKIFTSEGELEYIFCVYKNAKSRKFGEVGSNVIRPISHPHLENYQERSRMEMTFAAKDVKKIILNGKDITSNLQILKNESFENLDNEDTLYKLSCELKTGAIYSLQNYNNKFREIKDKMPQSHLFRAGFSMHIQNYSRQIFTQSQPIFFNFL
jgi:hypothetical protein